MASTITAKDLASKVDFLVLRSSGVSLFFQEYSEDSYTLEYDNGTHFLELKTDTCLPILPNGNVHIQNKYEASPCTCERVNLLESGNVHIGTASNG